MQYVVYALYITENPYCLYGLIGMVIAFKTTPFQKDER